MRTFSVELGDRGYPIHVGTQLLAELHQYITPLKPSKILAVSNPTVWALYGSKVESALSKLQVPWEKALIPDGEQYKNIETLSILYDHAAEARLDRKSIVLAVGGGVVGDISGFLAATYLRGLRFVQVPTTLLAQVDSSVGGKVAVNHPKGKNLLGAFHQPSMVVSDIGVLNSLPRRELLGGFAEVIKTAILGNAAFFSYLEEHLTETLALQPDALTEIVTKCCQIKAQVVAEDERESGIRAILNLGHTFGHAVEALTSYQTYIHGEAVGMGLAAAARYGQQYGNLSGEEAEQIVKLVDLCGLPTKFPKFELADYKAALFYDKKVLNDRLTLIVPEQIGKCAIIGDADVKQVLSVISEMIDRT